MGRIPLGMWLATGGGMAAAESFTALVIFPSTPTLQTSQADALLLMAQAAISWLKPYASLEKSINPDGE